MTGQVGRRWLHHTGMLKPRQWERERGKGEDLASEVFRTQHAAITEHLDCFDPADALDSLPSAGDGGVHILLLVVDE